MYGIEATNCEAREFTKGRRALRSANEASMGRDESTGDGLGKETSARIKSTLNGLVRSVKSASDIIIPGVT